MLTTFDYQGHSHLTSQQIFQAFYDCMRKVIWVVRIQYKNEQTRGAGVQKFESDAIRTGFCINSNGVILTSLNNVNCERIANIQVRKGTDGEFMDAELVKFDELEANHTDFVASRLIAYLRIKNKGPSDRFHYAQMVDMKVSVGEPVLSIAHPMSLVDTFIKESMVTSSGGVWLNSRNEAMMSISGFGDYDEVLGAPVFDINGKVFGVVVEHESCTEALKLTVGCRQLVRMEEPRSEEANDHDEEEEILESDEGPKGFTLVRRHTSSSSDEDANDDDEEEDKEILESNEDRKGITLVRNNTIIKGSSSSS